MEKGTVTITHNPNPTPKQAADWERLWRWLLFNEPLIEKDGSDVAKAS